MSIDAFNLAETRRLMMKVKQRKQSRAKMQFMPVFSLQQPQQQVSGILFIYLNASIFRFWG